MTPQPGWQIGEVPKPAADGPALALSLGLTNDEYTRIVSTLGRAPSSAELGTYSVMWSEHCSYKSSRRLLGELPTAGERILVGPGENAGVVDAGDGMAVVFKIESHNHPSFVEPFQGAATGVGGIVRDILTMGARPVALLDPLRFGDPTSARTRWLVDGVVRGIGHYGNSIGVATVGGEVAFDHSYEGNPLVNVLCVGVAPRHRIQRARAEAVGDVAVLIGQRTGRDGIGGASILASAEFSGRPDAALGSAGDQAQDKRPNVQVGDPFAGKLLIEACLALFEQDLLSGIQDMGAAGIACSTAEMASRAGLGMRVDLDRVPLREPSMQAWEILCSESQERMLALVAPERLARVQAVCARWGVDATPIGEVTVGDRLVFTRHGEVVHDVPATSLADEAPAYDRPFASWRVGGTNQDTNASSPPDDLGDAALRVLASPNVASAAWVWGQYDSAVGSATVLGPGADAAVLRLEPGSRRGVAVATDGNGRWCDLDPERGAQLVVAEAARNVACTGATPVAATNCLNFGSPERPEVMGAFRDTIRGLAAACEALGTPITGGNVSFYNQTGAKPIVPTPIVGVLGLIDDVAAAVGCGFVRPGDVVFLVGAATLPGLAGSEFARVQWGGPAGRLPQVDLAAEARLHCLLVAAAAQRVLRSAHDVTTGGLLATLVESCLSQGLGARVVPEPGVAAHQWLFSEAPTRVVVSTAPGDASRLADRCGDLEVPCRLLGTVTAQPRLVVEGVLTLDLDDAAEAVGNGLPAALGAGADPHVSPVFDGPA